MYLENLTLTCHQEDTSNELDENSVRHYPGHPPVPGGVGQGGGCPGSSLGPTEASASDPGGRLAWLPFSALTCGERPSGGGRGSCPQTSPRPGGAVRQHRWRTARCREQASRAGRALLSGDAQTPHGVTWASRARSWPSAQLEVGKDEKGQGRCPANRGQEAARPAQAPQWRLPPPHVCPGRSPDPLPHVTCGEPRLGRGLLHRHGEGGGRGGGLRSGQRPVAAEGRGDAGRLH